MDAKDKKDNVTS